LKFGWIVLNIPADIGKVAKLFGTKHQYMFPRINMTLQYPCRSPHVRMPGSTDLMSSCWNS